MYERVFSEDAGAAWMFFDPACNQYDLQCCMYGYLSELSEKNYCELKSYEIKLQCVG
ncbi:hypothetical protein [Zooshikella sp. RANM57]|uniref:hypothetical protein n=1 Tax=Zooshikella sp. RANM57 TaxID=3425863 RepID=UPI003D701EEB